MQWTEKYRPSCLAEVKGQETVVASLAKYLDEDTLLPHLLFYGPPGTGKTSAIMAFLNERYGGEDLKRRVLALNASDERGITTVRNRVKDFIRTRGSIHKYVVLDEADSMTTDAQKALRRIIEKAPLTSFCIICNYRARILGPLQSRCCAYQFEPLAPGTSLTSLKEVCAKEGLEVAEDELERLVKVTRGDLRCAIGRLQNLATVIRSGLPVDLVHDEIDGELLDEAYEILVGGLGEAKKLASPPVSLRRVGQTWNRLAREGHDVVSFLNGLSDLVVERQEAEDYDPLDPASLVEAMDLLSEMCDLIMVRQMDPKIVFHKLVG